MNKTKTDARIRGRPFVVVAEQVHLLGGLQCPRCNSALTDGHCTCQSTAAKHSNVVPVVQTGQAFLREYFDACHGGGLIA